jgi:hypothetical protein
MVKTVSVYVGEHLFVCRDPRRRRLFLWAKMVGVLPSRVQKLVPFMLQNLLKAAAINFLRNTADARGFGTHPCVPMVPKVWKIYVFSMSRVHFFFC